VFISTKGGHGTGIIVFQDMVLTVFHNLQVDSDIKVNGKVAKIIKVDPLHDLCLLGIKTPKGTTPVVFCITFGQNEAVACIGNPLNHKNIILKGEIIDFMNGFIYSDIHVMPGFSGGACYNEKAQLLGMVTAMQGEKGAGYPYSVIIPSQVILKFLMEN
jgi:S1-C subfamily serine protease